ncbi:MAG TPA: S8 family serine peptidase, partial [Actinomycetota bacterium]
MPGRFVSLIVSVVAALLLVSGRAFPALADSWPKGPPNDPGYEPAEQNPVEYSPSQEQTYLYSFLPKGAPLATDPEGSSGIWVDRAWRDFTIGRADTLIAYIEGGINWRAPDIAELADKVFINTGELPKKVRVHLRDWNHDGWISAPDVATATTKAKLAPVKDLNHNGIVDAEDVIARFSNGKDDDHNGYVDDISGWDFYDHQNDPGTVDSAYMHANGQMEQAAAITNNGIGTAGICPMCMIVPIKAGAEALDRDPDLAQAWLYATDIGADVIVSVTADLGYSTFMRQAVEYAVHHGVVAVQSSNDFDSTDHQGGMWWPHVLPGNGMVEDENVQELSHATTTYRARSGETSWGTHNMFTVATQGGSTSESTPTVGGVAAMLLSYGKTAAAKGLIRRPLTNFEAIQVLRSTASDVADPSLPWPGKPGWDLQYGYGRPNLWKAMRAVSRGDIPPAPTIESPGWFTYYDPTVTHTVNVFGHVEARRSSSYRWELRMGLGPEPTDSEFKVIGHGVGHAPRDGVLGVIDLRSIPKSFATAPFAISKDKELSTTEQYTVTLRLRVTDAQGRMGEERRTIFVHHDPTALPGFPLHVGPEVGQPALVDLNGDGRMDIVFGDVDGRVHAIDPKTRRELPGWPVTTDPIHVVKSHAGVHPGHEPLIDDVSVGDLDHNGHQWVVGTSEMGRVYVWDSHGHRRPGWPKLLDTNVHQPPVPRPNLPYTRLPVVGAFSPPVLSDLKGDGRLEIIQAGWDGFLHVWKPNGRTFPGWPVEVKLPASFQPEPGHFFINDHKLDDPAIVADLDG